MRFAVPIEPQPGEESVWDYPRPPRLERVEKPIQIVFGGTLIVDAPAGFRVLETSHPPVYYISPDDIAAGVLQTAPGSSLCEWKGRADYFDVVANGKVAAKAAWRYVSHRQLCTDRQLRRILCRPDGPVQGRGRDRYTSARQFLWWLDYPWHCRAVQGRAGFAWLVRPRTGVLHDAHVPTKRPNQIRQAHDPRPN